MDDLAALALACDEFAARLAAIGPDQHFLPTPCDDWNVYGLVSHVIGGNHMAVRLLAGAHRPEAIGYLSGLPLGDDPAATFAEGAEEMCAAFAVAGALERVCEHPVGDLPGEAVARLRVGDMLLHTWDLARATGGDDELHPELAERVLAEMEPLGDVIIASGVFGPGPSGTVAAGAPAQERLLDLVGRRPGDWAPGR